ncbi:hypothetical protein P3T76_004961 [Phytophthora citrophthora]|uniref:Uncharacterized protein n=1 Tax=Phytophthora citrophthora TaxID=4793 RepID=A0AAD9LNG5_9STRA|nr:hypothetical protein P3T76_004961 [Phytophthora citrophthora]
MCGGRRCQTGKRALWFKWESTVNREPTCQPEVANRYRKSGEGAKTKTKKRVVCKTWRTDPESRVEKKKPTSKTTEKDRYAAVTAVEELKGDGVDSGTAVKTIVQTFGVQPGTVYEWRRKVEHDPVCSPEMANCCRKTGGGRKEKKSKFDDKLLDDLRGTDRKITTNLDWSKAQEFLELLEQVPSANGKTSLASRFRTKHFENRDSDLPVTDDVSPRGD